MEYKQGDLVYNRYRLQQPLGDGGFSKVWKAVDEEAVTMVAIKLFLVRDAEGVELCRSEYQQTFDLRHAHILKPTFFGVDRGITPFLLMPFCSRGSLEGKRLPEREIASLLAQVGGALAYLHGLPSPVVHYDLRPDNVLVNDAGEYMLSDFGISRKLELRLTNPLLGVGNNYSRGLTPMPYRAPELCTTETGNQVANTRTDIWALGATAYYLATGLPPFREQGGYAQNLYTGAEDPLQMLPRHWPSSLSPSLLTLLTACLAKAPWDRPGAQQLVDEANHYLLTTAWKLKEVKAPLPPPVSPAPSNNPSSHAQPAAENISSPQGKWPNAGAAHNSGRGEKYTAPVWQRAQNAGATPVSRGAATSDGQQTVILIAALVALVLLLSIGTAAWRFMSYRNLLQTGEQAWSQGDWPAAEAAYAQATGYRLFKTDRLEALLHNARRERRLAEYETVGRPAEGLLAVRDTTADGQLRWGYADTSGSILQIALLYDEAGTFEGGKARVRRGKDHFDIDRQGRRVIVPGGNSGTASDEPADETSDAGSPEKQPTDDNRPVGGNASTTPAAKPPKVTNPPPSAPKPSAQKPEPPKELRERGALRMPRASSCQRSATTTAILQLRPSAEMELKTITLWATACGSLRIALDGRQLDRTVSEGENTISLNELDVRLQSGKNYSLSLSMQPGGRCPAATNAPQLESERGCGAPLSGSSQLEIIANTNQVVYEIRYRY